MIREQWVIGIDGGGTSTRAIICGMDGELAAEAAGASSNPHNVGYDQAAHVVAELIGACCEKVAATGEDLYAVSIGIAGGGRTEDRAEFQQRLAAHAQKKKIRLKNVIIESDFRIALEAAFAGGPGIVLIAGTGSIACAKDTSGVVSRAGGWGRLLGDEGSGYALSCEAINAALRAHDGRGNRTMLLSLALEHFGVPSVDDLILNIYRDAADVASFAPMVFRAEAERDHVAHGILFKGAHDLAELVRALTKKFTLARKLQVCLMGGLLQSENVYSKMVRDTITRTLPQVVIQKPKFPAPFGAVILALQPFTFTGTTR